MEPQVDIGAIEETAVESTSEEPTVDGSQQNSNDPAHYEDEAECRVCRGPSEEGRPLLSPCKCSGSIGLTHQDCLVSWLEVTRRDGRCELCKTKFRFDPVYAENSPDRLSPYEVALGLSSRFLAKWLPFTLRLITVALCWLVIAPLLTSCLYHLWMHRPSSVLTRWKRELIPADIVSGAVIAAIVIISFLSLMSFADFLRVHWQQQPQPRPHADNNARAGRGRNRGANDNHEYELVHDDNIDDSIAQFIEKQRNQRQRLLEEESSHQARDDDGGDDDIIDPSQTVVHVDHELQRLRDMDLVLQNNNFFIVEQPIAENRTGIREVFHMVDENADSDEDSGMPPLGDDGLDDDADSDDFGDDEDDEAEDNDNDHAHDIQPPRNNGAFDPLDPLLQDDPVDMEINVALDELLGLRGPPGTLIRNLLWLLAFNASYLGLFAFVPKTVGSAVHSGILNTTFTGTILRHLPYVYSDDVNTTTFATTISRLNEASAEKDTTFRLPDVATVILGYLSIGAILVVVRYGWALSRTIQRQFSVEGTRIRTNRDERNEIVWEERRGQRDAILHAPRPGGIAATPDTLVGAWLDATVVVVKVGVLLFLKMFILPMTLGLCLDASTTTLLGHTLTDRIKFAGTDLFSFTLLHWVAGITFMLLVTVFLLQLREVIHPDLLARLIRPQEPQPDLLGNLMQETVLTHTKRIFMSLAIYAPLLFLHVTLPVRLLLASGLTDYCSFFKINLWHVVMPQLQIPLELVIFHLSTLALLERNKNLIGTFQHNWMKFLCRKMGLTEYILPLSVEKFELVGTKRVFCAENNIDDEAESFTVDEFWYELANRSKDFDAFIESNMERSSVVRHVEGETKTNGNRVFLASLTHIRIPGDEDEGETLIPTKVGRYRLNFAQDSDEDDAIIEFWKESPGAEISRPPEGWDDLGVGGAFIQGRWAWGDEKKSVVEGGVAERTYFRDPITKKRPTRLMLKLGALMVMSWLAIVCTVLGFIGIPVAIGRSLYYLFRIPQSYIHDPLAFVVGGCLFFPTAALAMKHAKLEQGNLVPRFHSWIESFNFPPRPKLRVLVETIVLWFFVAPMALGLSYEVIAVRSDKWFSGAESLLHTRSLMLCWLVGFAVLNAWAYCACFSVFTRKFWSNIGHGMLEPPVDDDGNPVPARNDAGNEAEAAQETPWDWQGPNGRVARFFNVWKSIALEWNWEKVDSVTLLDDFSRPIAKQLASALVGSSLSFQFTLILAPLVFSYNQGGIMIPFAGSIPLAPFRRAVFQICMASHVLIQLGSAFRSKLEGWFEAAHAAARDDRYLIGEVLVNYEGDGYQNH